MPYVIYICDLRSAVSAFKKGALLASRASCFTGYCGELRQTQTHGLSFPSHLTPPPPTSPLLSVLSATSSLTVRWGCLWNSKYPISICLCLCPQSKSLPCSSVIIVLLSPVVHCRVHENKGLWLEIIVSTLLPQIAYLADGRCIIDGARSPSSLKITSFKTYRGLPGRGGTTTAGSYPRQVNGSTRLTSIPLPPTPTLSDIQEVSAANASRLSAGATRRPKTTTTASWRLTLPSVSLGAGW
jgi:hypothetical protein